MRQNWIETASGKAIDFADIDNNYYDIGDIAHALGQLCRYTGHCRKFYTVAEHSVHMSRLVEPDIALFALMHDAVEAYVGDVSAPLKGLLVNYKAIEHRIADAVMLQFCGEVLDGERYRRVKIADIRILLTEAEQLMYSHGENWPLRKKFEPFDIQLACWDCVGAQCAFLHRYKELTQ